MAMELFGNRTCLAPALPWKVDARSAAGWGVECRDRSMNVRSGVEQFLSEKGKPCYAERATKFLGGIAATL